MEREPLDSLEYESTYLELRPSRERLVATRAPLAVPAPPADCAGSYRRADSSLGGTGRAPRWPSLPPLALALTSAVVGYAADRDVRVARSLLMILTGVVLCHWARAAWRANPQRGPLGLIATRALDRLVTGLGTVFAFMLWARYLPQASVGFSRAAAVVLCGLGLARGLIAAVRFLRP